MSRSVRPPRSILPPRVAGARRIRGGGAPLLVALGDLMLDVIVAPARTVEQGTDVPGTVTFRRGGSAANVCASFVRAGGRARLVTSVGSDPWVRHLLAAVRADGVLAGVVRHAGPSGRLAALLETDGERSFVTQRGAADALRPTDLRDAWFTGAAVLHIPAYSLLARPIADAAAKAASLARAAGALVSVDLSSQGPLLDHGPSAVGARIDAIGASILFASRDEATALLGRRATSSLPRLLDLAPLVIVKDGRAGARVLWREAGRGGTGRIDVAAERLRVSDSTGAGDAFAAGFLRVIVDGPGPPALRIEPTAGGSAFDPALLRRATLAGHRAAGQALARRPADLELG